MDALEAMAIYTCVSWLRRDMRRTVGGCAGIDGGTCPTGGITGFLSSNDEESQETICRRSLHHGNNNNNSHTVYMCIALPMQQRLCCGTTTITQLFARRTHARIVVSCSVTPSLAPRHHRHYSSPHAARSTSAPPNCNL